MFNTTKASHREHIYRKRETNEGTVIKLYFV